MRGGPQPTFFQEVAGQLRYHKLALCALIVIILFCLMGIYAPLVASSKPLFVIYDGFWYFPLFRYLFFSGYYTKAVDLFFNILIFTFPLLLFTAAFCRRKMMLLIPVLLQLGAFFSLFFFPLSDPAFDAKLSMDYKGALEKVYASGSLPTWQLALSYMSPYQRLNLLSDERLQKRQDERLQHYFPKGEPLDTPWQRTQRYESRGQKGEGSLGGRRAEIGEYIRQQRSWIERERAKIALFIPPLLREFHWEEDAGGSQEMNQVVPWWELTRINRKDLLAALFFGTRISLVVGILAVSLALAIGVPIGAFAGYFGGKWDIAICRLLEIWESMPLFFMLLLIVAITGSKSIFLVIGVVGLFGWTGFSRYMRGECLKQRALPYVEACYASGFSSSRIVFVHLLPNAIPPVLTLLPFAIMGAITSEAGLSFLGLGEEGSCSWGVLMDEGRNAFPGEAYLLWPPAILLTILLVAIALVGDAVRDLIDPKMRRD